MAELVRRRATYRFDGSTWIVFFPDLGISTFGRTLAAAKRHARSALRVYLEVGDLAAAGVEVVDEVQLPVPGLTDVDRLVAMGRDAEALRQRVADETRRVAAQLREAGLSTRDVGDILGISAARVGQLEQESSGS